QRIRKDSPRVAAYGTIDETNAAIGMARVYIAESHPELDAMLARIQNDLFDLGAELSVPATSGEQKSSRLEITAAQVKRLENEIDKLNAELQPLRSFVLPGGSPGAAALHMARTICRSAEPKLGFLEQMDNRMVILDELQSVSL